MSQSKGCCWFQVVMGCRRSQVRTVSFKETVYGGSYLASLQFLLWKSEQDCHCIRLNYYLKTQSGGLPWWRTGWESACRCGGHGFEPWSGKIPRAAEQLGPWATTTEPARLEPVLCSKRGHDSERPAHRDEEWPPLAATGGSPPIETKTQRSHK